MSAAFCGLGRCRRAAATVDSNASVARAQNGLALRLDVPDDATGTISVPYTADDGRGLSDSATATVEVRPWEVNSAPEQLTTLNQIGRASCRERV